MEMALDDPHIDYEIGCLLCIPLTVSNMPLAHKLWYTTCVASNNVRHVNYIPLGMLYVIIGSEDLLHNNCVWLW